ncbi:Predicted branched-chain amino acid permease (azaleucine resistance) [Ruminococcaceae bacterium YRB3002]|nr:Predicted branched-chain amino acid permease (azaleucine resistance) [Ruminococcaceae bacterium YRB3002]
MDFRRGFKDGLAIGLGYLSVSFSFGILAVTSGLSWWQAVLVSFTNLTSAGQVAGVGIMAAGGSLIEMAVATFVINLRYALMGVSLSQKTDDSMTTPARMLTGFFITDEIFGVASGADHPVSCRYMLGIGILPVAGWTLGTLLGAVCGNILPAIVTNALSIGIYGMFVAIVIPASRRTRAVAIVSLIAVMLSCIFYYVPVLKNSISSGFAIIICSVVASLAGAIFMPSRENSGGIGGSGAGASGAGTGERSEEGSNG